MARVLVVDDDPLALRAFERILSDAHAVALATGVPAAIALLQIDDRFDAVLCDIMMPGADGVDFHAALRERWPHLQDRTLYYSAGPFTERARAFAALLGDRCIDKVMDAEDLRAAVDRLLARAAPPTGC